ncbi:MAG TPA: hypothetical protein GX005_04440 [Bacteroidales bacterium]|nr:hypothetical protein [Bacteroidales bacterium]
MRYALIDNSTLTGIQRLLGEIPVKNKTIIDNDIIAFENYIQAILFYDSIICIDDYKEQYRNRRIQYFSDIRFISKDLFDYDSFLNLSNEVTKDISLEIRGGKITDKDFKEYFDRLHMTFQFTWDMSSSEFFLTQKMLLGNSILDQEQFSVLHSILFKENNEQYEVTAQLPDKKPILFDSKGKQISINPQTGKLNSSVGDGFSPQFKALVSSLNWMSQRTAFYVLAAEYLYADLFIQPIRQSFLQNIIKRTYPNYKLGVFGDFRNSINNQSEETVKNILSTSDNFGISVDIPLFSAYFANKTKNPLKIIEAAYAERDKQCFREARNKLRELNNLLDVGKRGKFIRDINLLNTSINENFKSIESKYGLGNKQGFATSQLKFLFSFIPSSDKIKTPKVLDVRIKELEFMKHLVPRKGFNAVYRNVIEDLVVFDALGQYKDILISKVTYHKDASSYGIKTEDPRFVRASSYWKKPM